MKQSCCFKGRSREDFSVDLCFKILTFPERLGRGNKGLEGREIKWTLGYELALTSLGSVVRPV